MVHEVFENEDMFIYYVNGIYHIATKGALITISDWDKDFAINLAKEVNKKC